MTIALSGFLFVNPVNAATWMSIGEDDGYIYYVDVDSLIQGETNPSMYALSIKLIDSNDVNYGDLYIDCSNYSAKLSVSVYKPIWYKIKKNSPEYLVASSICK